MADTQYPIHLAARLTGLSAHVIRVWEQRYRAVVPRRTPGNQRLYSQSDIDRLNLLREVTRAGHSIGQVAALPTDTLSKLAAASAGTTGLAPRAMTDEPSTGSFLDECLAAIKALDARAFDDALQRAVTGLGSQGFLQRVVAPLAQTLGDLWRDGALTAAHEHFACAAMRVFLGNSFKPSGATASAPVLLVATPAGQVHELGALMVSAAAANLGWQVTYLGTSLPAAEIAGAARQCRARAVALSLVYPEDDPQMAGELTRLREWLPSEVALIVGGRAAPAYGEILAKIGAVTIENINQLGSYLDSLRKPAKASKMRNEEA